MKVAVYGVGGVGGYFGGRLAQTAGAEVTFIARGRHLEAMKESGLTVSVGSEEFVVRPCHATSEPESIGAVDVVLVCVKSWQVPEVAERIRGSGLVGEDTVVVPLQNGLDSITVLRDALGSGHVCGGLCRLYGYIEAPGRIVCPSDAASLHFGGIGGGSPGASNPKLRQLAEAFSAAGLSASLLEDVWPEVWRKFATISCMSAVGSVTRARMGEVVDSPRTLALLEQCLREVCAVAAAKGVPLADLDPRVTVGMLRQKLPREFQPSMARDVLDGRPSELESQVGTVVRMGEELGVPTPAFSVIYAALLPLEARARSGSP